MYLVSKLIAFFIPKSISEGEDSKYFCKQMDVPELQDGIEHTATWYSFTARRLLVSTESLTQRFKIIRTIC